MKSSCETGGTSLSYDLSLDSSKKPPKHVTFIADPLQRADPQSGSPRRVGQVLQVAGAEIELNALVKELRKQFKALVRDSNDIPLVSGGIGRADCTLRQKLIDYLVACCRAVAKELTPDEAKVWNQFVSQDEALKCELPLREQNIKHSLRGLNLTDEFLERSVKSMRELYAKCEYIDFVDVLEWLESVEEERHDIVQTLTSTVLTWFNPPGANALASTVSDLEVAGDLWARLIEADINQVRHACVAYRATFLVNALWRCERKLIFSLKPFLPGFDVGVDPPIASPVKPLLSIIRAIHEDLVPVERVLWGLIVSKSDMFDGFVRRSEVESVLDYLEQFLRSYEIGVAPDELEELRRLRRHCRQESMENLFKLSSGSCRPSVTRGRSKSEDLTIVNVFSWWWDMSEEYRSATGLVIPQALLRALAVQEPEVRFAAKLKFIAVNPDAAKKSFRNHVRLFGHLHVLRVRRMLEAIKSGGGDGTP